MELETEIIELKQQLIDFFIIIVEKSTLIPVKCPTSRNMFIFWNLIRMPGNKSVMGLWC